MKPTKRQRTVEAVVRAAQRFVYEYRWMDDRLTRAIVRLNRIEERTKKPRRPA